MTEAPFELSTSIFIDAPPDKVWNVLVNRMEEWWCPKPWNANVTTLDRRAGGGFALTMYGPNGEEMPNEGIFLEWTEGKRFVTTDAVNAELEPNGPFMIGFWEIEPEGDGTRYTGRARHWTEEAMKQHEEMGFADGWGTVAKQLRQLCESD
ncbi:SRPBCC domain-containing protein [Parasphingopyxis lamellibrachiae]|uniref:Uncharacterized protein YndB with AHSA1/START domain n=1 Tax=Parasphingopyxis lamellibrachiae TaxID=680125 RepID=A0A3D9FEM0_9SPHN|nr:SRPBCC domain-containing protein [Parasphingopyxis lamellibrachiae]RED16012.1 uncharacterized protein YndB with AHSA1/START domain [Parasphingopyxis lamellibrachiae]